MLHRISQLWDKYIKSLNPRLNYLFAASCVLVILHDFVFSGSPELFTGAGKAWDLVYRLSLALLSSYVFYFVVIHLARIEDKENLQAFIRRKTQRIIIDAENVIAVLRMTSGHQFSGKYPELSDVRTMCDKVNPEARTPGSGPHIAIRDYLSWCGNWTKESIKDIYSLMPFLETEYVRLLTNIDHSSYLALLLRESPRRDLAVLAGQLHEYLEDVKKLKEYGHKHNILWRPPSPKQL